MNKGTFALYSQGCCGSAHMVELLKSVGLKRIAGSEIYNVHSQIIPKHCDGKILYMYADPRNILLSSLIKNNHNKWSYHHCKYVGGDYEFFGKEEKVSIDVLLKKMYDPFHLATHFKNWLAPVDYPIMMLKYEALEKPETFQNVLDFFGVEESLDYEWKTRKTSWEKQTAEQQYKITLLFYDLIALQNQFPDCCVRNA